MKMELPNLKPNQSSFAIKELRRCTVKASKSVETYIMPISYLDYFTGRPKITIFYAYEKPPLEDSEFSSIVSAMKSALAEALVHYYPFAGRSKPNPVTGVDEIHCNNEGVEVIEALADVPLAAMDFHDLDKSVGNIMMPSSNEALVNSQITSFSCGGFTISWSIDHMLGDAAAYTMFIVSWAEVARTKNLSPALIPNHDRSLFRCPRTPPRFNSPSLLEIFDPCTMDKVTQALTAKGSVEICQKRLYYVDGSSLTELRADATAGGVLRTKVQAFTAYLWKMVAKSLGDQRSRMSVTVNGRSRIRSVCKQSLSNYCGNVVSMAIAEADNEDVKERTLSEVSEMVADSITSVANEEHFLEAIDFVASQKTERVYLRMYTQAPPQVTVVVTAGQNFPTMSADFGFGPPAMGTYYVDLRKMAFSYVNMMSTGKGDGSWFVFAFVWPELAAVLDSDPRRVFQPFKPELCAH